MISCADRRFQLTFVFFSYTLHYVFSVILFLPEKFPFNCISETIDFFNWIKMYRFVVENYPHPLVLCTLNFEVPVMNEIQ